MPRKNWHWAPCPGCDECAPLLIKDHLVKVPNVTMAESVALEREAWKDIREAIDAIPQPASVATTEDGEFGYYPRAEN